jgi:hypothetical protein
MKRMFGYQYHGIFSGIEWDILCSIYYAECFRSLWLL